MTFGPGETKSLGDGDLRNAADSVASGMVSDMETSDNCRHVFGDRNNKDVVARTVDALRANDGEQGCGPTWWVHTVSPLHHDDCCAYGQACGDGRLPLADQLWAGRGGGLGGERGCVDVGGWWVAVPSCGSLCVLPVCLVSVFCIFCMCIYTYFFSGCV